MTPCRDHLLSILETWRGDLVQRSTDIAFASNDTPMTREDVEQMMRACVTIIEEGLAGKTTEVRDGFLEALPEIALSTTWELTLKNGIPCWGVILGQLSAAASHEFRDEAIVFLSRFIGQWWSDVSKAMLPVFLAEGTL